MRLVLGLGGGGSSYYPYTQKPVDYQPYRPIYLYRGPPPDAGFSYGLFEDEEEQKQYYAELGLESFSPFSGKPAKLLQEINLQDLQKAKALENLEDCECQQCGAIFKENLKTHFKGRDIFFCHRCGAKLNTMALKK